MGCQKITSDISVKTPIKGQEDSFKRRVSFLDWRNYTANKMKNEFNKHFKGINIYNKDPESINTLITNAICMSLNKLVPKRTITVNCAKAVASPVIQNLKNQKRRIYKKWMRNKDPLDFERLKVISRKFNDEIRHERNKQMSSQLNGSPKDYWSAINKIMGKGGTSIKSLKIGDTSTEDSGAIANEFARFFQKKINDITTASECDNFEIPPLDYNVDEIRFFNESDVTQALQDIKGSKAQGFDEIPGR